MTYIATSVGKHLTISNPIPDMISLRDIVQGLSREGRFANQSNEMWTVAEHSMLVARNVRKSLRKVALLHDATEAYMRDMAAPIKRDLEAYNYIEGRIWCAIANRFDLPIIIPKEVKEADRRAQATEKRDLLPNEGDWPSLEGVRPFEERLIGHKDVLPFGQIQRTFVHDLMMAGVR